MFFKISKSWDVKTSLIAQIRYSLKPRLENTDPGVWDAEGCRWTVRFSVCIEYWTSARNVLKTIRNVYNKKIPNIKLRTKKSSTHNDSHERGINNKMPVQRVTGNKRHSQLLIGGASRWLNVWLQLTLFPCSLIFPQNVLPNQKAPVLDHTFCFYHNCFAKQLLTIVFSNKWQNKFLLIFVHTYTTQWLAFLWICSISTCTKTAQISNPLILLCSGRRSPLPVKSTEMVNNKHTPCSFVNWRHENAPQGEWKLVATSFWDTTQVPWGGGGHRRNRVCWWLTRALLSSHNHIRISFTGGWQVLQHRIYLAGRWPH